MFLNEKKRYNKKDGKSYLWPCLIVVLKPKEFNYIDMYLILTCVNVSY